MFLFSSHLSHATDVKHRFVVFRLVLLYRDAHTRGIRERHLPVQVDDGGQEGGNEEADSGAQGSC